MVIHVYCIVQCIMKGSEFRTREGVWGGTGFRKRGEGTRHIRALAYNLLKFGGPLKLVVGGGGPDPVIPPPPIH